MHLRVLWEIIDLLSCFAVQFLGRGAVLFSLLTMEQHQSTVVVLLELIQYVVLVLQDRQVQHVG